MPSPRRRLYDQVPNRGVTELEAATYLGLSQGRFRDLRPALEAAGFPAPDPLTRRTDRAAIDRWLDGRAGLGGNSEELRRRIENYGQDQGAPSRH